MNIIYVYWRDPATQAERYIATIDARCVPRLDERVELTAGASRSSGTVLSVTHDWTREPRHPNAIRLVIGEPPKENAP